MTYIDYTHYIFQLSSKFGFNNINLVSKFYDLNVQHHQFDDVNDGSIFDMNFPYKQSLVVLCLICWDLALQTLFMLFVKSPSFHITHNIFIVFLSSVYSNIFESNNLFLKLWW
jgi:hypothetical protein